MIEEKLIFEENEKDQMPQLSSRTLSFYGTQQRENKSRILYTDGNQFLIHTKFQKLNAKYIFHVCFQLSTIIDYVSYKYIILIIYLLLYRD